MADDLADTTPSAKLVYKILEYNGALTQKQIAEESLLPYRTVRDALDRLGERDIVAKEIYIPDARQNTYRITGGECITGSECESAHPMARGLPSE